MAKINGFGRFGVELEEFANDLEDIADELDQAVDRGTKKTALDVESTSKRLAPVEDGALRASIATTKLGLGVYSVGSNVEHAPPTEYGSQPHPITPNEADALHFFWEKKGEWVTRQIVQHPGTPAQPFLRPALNRHRTELVENISDEIEKVVEEYR